MLDSTDLQNLIEITKGCGEKPLPSWLIDGPTLIAIATELLAARREGGAQGLDALLETLDKAGYRWTLKVDDPTTGGPAFEMIIRRRFGQRVMLSFYGFTTKEAASSAVKALCPATPDAKEGEGL